jgi:regulator of sigma E protease
MEVISTIFYFIVTIFVLVSVHEFGHFIAARMFGIYVPVYSIGMGRRLFGWNKINGFTLNNLPEEIEEKLGKNTDYRLSLLPIGGYAKIAGMIDETQQEEMSGPIQPWEFRAKSWWKKSIVICAGVTLNFLLAAAIFIGIKFSEGRQMWETTTVSYVSPSSLSAKLGVQAGDKILSVNNKPVKYWQDLQTEVFEENADHDFTLTVDRGGEQKTFTYHKDEFGNIFNDPGKVEKNFGLVPEGWGGVKLTDGPVATYPADKIGLKKDDIITRVNDMAVTSSVSLVDNISSNAEKEISLTWMRGAEVMNAKVTPNKDGKIGIQMQDLPFAGKIKREDYSMGQAISIGFGELFSQTQLFIKNIMMLFAGKASVKDSLGGPIKIAQYAGKSAAGGVVAFLSFMAMLSLSLAFLNILPIPALDGGHLIIILIEAVIGRELSQRFKIGFQKVGVTMLLLLMAFMVFNDVSGLLK